ncbi:MAG TPA: MarR family winged helix-turn-helix transcriptional regulator [Anaerolineales bacterium]|nr:MarR family winged helix-turn-helix transcriptional regulator [Anaerolineales bacterium]
MPREDFYALARQVAPCVGFNTRRATRLVTQYYDHALAPVGLRSTQYSLLGLLALVDEIPMQELALVLAMDRTTLTRNLNPLLEKELIEVSVGSDRRVRPIKITPKGVAILAEALPLWEQAQARIVDQLGPDKWDEMMRGLHQISMIVEDSNR